MEWPNVRVGDVCDVVIGATPARNRPEYWGGGSVWVTVAELNDNVITASREQITDAGVAHSASKLIRAGTLLFSFKLSIGKMAFAGVDLYTNEAIAALPIRHRNLVDHRYLFYALRSIGAIPGANVAAKGEVLNRSAVESLPIPLPPLSEQSRIVEILDQADRLRRLRAEADAKAGHILRALYCKLFLDRVSDWPTEPLGTCLRTTKGALQSGPFGSHLHNSDFVESGPVRVVGIDNVLDGEFSLGRNRRITAEKYEELKKYTLEPGDILVTIMGTVGRTCVFPQLREATICTKHVYRIQVDERLDPEYVSASIRFSPAVRDQLGASITGQIVAGITSDSIRQLELLIPPRELQDRFASQARTLSRQRRERRQAAVQLDRLFVTLLRDAFSGRLTHSWREAHMKELLQEIEQQAKALASVGRLSDDG